MCLTLDDLSALGASLDRPECVPPHASGLLIAPGWSDSGGIALIAPDGWVARVLEDVDAGHLVEIERAFRAAEMGRPHLDQIRSRRLGSLSDIAFGGPDLRTGHLGSLPGGAVESFACPVAGRALPHWRADLGPLALHLEPT